MFSIQDRRKISAIADFTDWTNQFFGDQERTDRDDTTFDPELGYTNWSVTDGCEAAQSAEYLQTTLENRAKIREVLDYYIANFTRFKKVYDYIDVAYPGVSGFTPPEPQTEE